MEFSTIVMLLITIIPGALYFFGRHRAKHLEYEILKYQNEKRIQEFNKRIDEINNKKIEVREDYEKHKKNIYSIIDKLNSNKPSGPTDRE